MENKRCHDCGCIGRMNKENNFFICECGGHTEIPDYSEYKINMEKKNEKNIL